MARQNRVWFRKDVGWWMVTLAGKKVRLVQGRANKKAAEQKFHELKVAQARPTECGDRRVAEVIEKFLEWAKLHRSSESNRNYTWYGQQFAERFGYLVAAELRPIHLTEWVDEHRWGQTTQRNARRSIYRAFSWADEQGLMRPNPLKGMRCPGALIRQRAMTDAEFRSLLRGSRPEFKILLFALRMTGCRPKEARTLTWDQVLEDRWVLPEHKTAYKTRWARVIYLNAPLRKLMGVLRKKARGTHVFLNGRGQPWSRNAVRLRIERLRRKLKLSPDLCAYHARHAYGTSAVLNGVDPLSVATLMGHTSLEMVSKVYVHLAGEHKHLQNAAELATRRPDASKPRASSSGQGA